VADVSHVVTKKKIDMPQKCTLTMAAVVRDLWHAKACLLLELKIRISPVLRQTSLQVLTPSVYGLVCRDKGQSSCLEILVSSLRIWFTVSAMDCLTLSVLLLNSRIMMLRIICHSCENWLQKHGSYDFARSHYTSR